MKKLSFAVLLAAFALGGCKDESGVIGESRIFTLVPETEEGWPGGYTYEPIDYSWTVIAQGTRGAWKTEFVDMDPAPFTVSENHTDNKFTVSVPQNNTTVTRRARIKVTYNDDTWKYLTLVQIPNIMTIDPGEPVPGNGALRYIVNDDGSAGYVGSLFIPGADQVEIVFVAGSGGATAETFTPVLEPVEGRIGFYTLQFTAPVAENVIGWREAEFMLLIDGQENETHLFARQYQLGLPLGATPDPTAPGGYFYRLRNNGMDVAGTDLETYNGESLDGKTWNDVFDPEGKIPNESDWAKVIDSEVNPCPEGWRAMNRDDAFRVFGGKVNGAGGKETGLPQNYEGAGGSRNWFILNYTPPAGQNINIFAHTGANYYFIVGPTIGTHASTKQCARINVRVGTNPLEITNAGRTVALTHSGSTWYGIRCVRDTP